MLFICILVAIIGVASAQHHQHLVPLKEMRHLQAIQQPHLPQDINVVAATQQFLHQFAQLKALADAAPDPPAKGTHHVAAVHNPFNGAHQHHIHHQPQFAHHQAQQSQHVHHQPQQSQHVHHQPQQSQHVHHQPQQSQHVHHGHVPIVNHQGIVVNPNQYPGPLAHNLPAGVHGR